MGLFDLPAPVLGWVDALLSPVLPDVVRLVLWGAAGGIVSMLLFRILSPQARIAELKHAAHNARARLEEFDGPLGEAWPQMRHMLALSIRQVGVVLGPAVAASLPALCLIVWVSNAFGPIIPAHAHDVGLNVQPADLSARWSEQAGDVSIEVTDATNAVVATVALGASTTVLHKRQWWNVLIANPGGYLDDGAPAERIDIELPERELLPFGPSWVRTWELIFFTTLVVCSIAIKLALRIE